MKEKVCCILDEDENYVIRLTEYINEKKAMPYKAMAFSSVESLLNCSGKYDIELLLSGVALSEEEKSVCNAVICISLVETETNQANNEICRYQPADHLVRDVLLYFSGIPRKKQIEKTMIYSVYSPGTKCFKTTFALSMAVCAAKMRKTLFINLEQFAGLDGLLSSQRGGISDALYYYRTGRENSYGKIISCTDSMCGFDYFYPAGCADDIADLTDEQLQDFIFFLSENGAYENIIIDVGNMFQRPWKLFEISDSVFMPEPFDYMGQKKISQFMNYLMLTGRNEVADKIVKVKIPYWEDMAGYEISRGFIMDGRMTEVVGRFMNG